jgi:microcystin-dependent protein
MARAHFTDVALNPQGEIVEDVLVTVTLRQTEVLAPIYATETTTVPLENPYYTTDGYISQWADAGAYDVHIEDIQSPPRLTTRTVGWSAIPGVQGGIPGGLIADLGITNAQLAAGIDGGKLANDSVVNAKLADAVKNALLPVGSIVPFGGSLAPDGFLLCDGTDYSQSEQSGLYAVLGTAFNQASGHPAPAAGRFRVPDLRGRSLMGVGTGIGLTARTLAGYGGAETHVLTEAQMPSHDHDIQLNGQLFSGPVGGATPGYVAGVRGDTGLGGPAGQWSYDVLHRGGGVAHNNTHPYLALNHLIKN